MTIRHHGQLAPRNDWLLPLGYHRIHGEETRWRVWESDTTPITQATPIAA